MSSAKVLKSARLISLLTLASRVLGLGRDMACSYAFGAGTIWSAWTIASQIPSLFRRLFGEGALTAAACTTLEQAVCAEVDDAVAFARSAPVWNGLPAQ
jgi:putative peptidoglycan lipid II flippase